MNKPSPATDREFLAPLHGLRGIAVLYVIVSHLGNGGRFLLPLPHDAIGKAGVWIFFALSAFLLTTHLCRDIEATASKTTTLMQYLIHRIFRIYPLYTIVLIAHLAASDISFSSVFTHLMLTEGWGELWAISVEFQFYLVIPLIALGALCLPRRCVILLLLAALLVTLFYGYVRPASVFSNELNIIPKLSPFLTGSMLALLPLRAARLQSTPPGKLSLVISVACIGGLLFSTVTYRFLSKDELPNMIAPWLSFALAVSVAGLIYSALRPGFIASFLGVRPLIFMGEISFSLYLLHMFVIRVVQRPGYLPSVLEAWASLLLSILCASVSYWLIERPGIRFGKWLGQKLGDVACRWRGI